MRKTQKQRKALFFTCFLILSLFTFSQQKVFANGNNPLTNEPASTWAVTATAFKLAGEKDVNHVKIHWEQRGDIDLYKVYRDGQLIGESTGNMFDDYNLALGKTYSYYVEGYKDGHKIDASNSHQAETFLVGDGLPSYDNIIGQHVNKVQKPDGFKINNKYYRYSIRSVDKTIDEGAGKKAAKGRAVYEMVSPNGLDNWSSERELAFYPDPANFEGIRFLYNKETQKIVLTAHYEDEGGYTAAKFYIAHITPGGKLEVTFEGRPLDFDSRDQSIFIDDDYTAYILSATNTNKDINIYKLDKSWSKPVELVNTVFKGQHRETPTIIKKDGIYYFFSSKASGWYPSQAMYASATDLAGDWTPLREIGNNATFGTQTTGISTYGTKRSTYAMNGYRWGAQYKHKEPEGNIMRQLPINFNAGYASMDYYSSVEFHDEHGLIPVQAGRNLTLGKPVTATSINIKEGPASAVTDGASLSGSKSFKGGRVPYSLTIDMEKATKIAEINFSPKLVGGSETAYKYKIEGSVDGENYKTLIDNTQNWKVGFQILKIEDQSAYRYIRLNVRSIINIHNNNGAEWADGVYEITAFGT